VVPAGALRVPVSDRLYRPVNGGLNRHFVSGLRSASLVQNRQHNCFPSAVYTSPVPVDVEGARLPSHTPWSTASPPLSLLPAFSLNPEGAKLFSRA
jgi:hypothetical protein